MEQFLAWLADHWTSIVVWLFGSGGGVAIGWRWYRRASRAIRLSDFIYRRFGSVDSFLDSVARNQRSRAESAIRQSMVEKALGLGVFVADHLGQLEFANPFYSNLLGLDSSEMRGSGWLRACEPGSKHRVWEAWKFAVSNQTPYSEDYVIQNCMTHEKITVRAQAKSILDGDELVCFVGSVQEICNETKEPIVQDRG